MTPLTVKTVLRTAAVVVISTGLSVIAVGAFFLKKLDDHAYGDPGVYYSSVRHYASISDAGALICFAGFIALAMTQDYKEGFRAAVTSAVVGFATVVLGLFLFPIHNASGGVYFILVSVAFGASVAFLFAACVRYIYYRIHALPK